jgi:hypothetical protein
MWLALIINLQSSEKNITLQPAKPQIVQIIQETKVPFEQIYQATYTTYETLANDIHERGLIQTLSRTDYIHQLKQDSTLDLKPETRDLLTHIDSTEYAPVHNQVIRQIIYETLFDQLRSEMKFKKSQFELMSIAHTVTSQLHKQFDPNHKQISEHMQIQRIDPGVWSSLNQETICAIFDQIVSEEQERLKTKQLKIKKGLAQAPKKVPDSDSLETDTYYIDGVLKYSHNHAADTLAQHNIKLRSTLKWYHEIGNNQSTGRTSLVWINVNTIDYIISLKQTIDQKYGDTGIWYFTWWTEWWDHRPWARSHANGFKWDIRWRWIQQILLAIQYWSDTVNRSRTVVDPERWLKWVFTYHWPDHHMDILVIPNNDLVKN